MPVNSQRLIWCILLLVLIRAGETGAAGQQAARPVGIEPAEESSGVQSHPSTNTALRSNMSLQTMQTEAWESDLKGTVWTTNGPNPFDNHSEQLLHTEQTVDPEGVDSSLFTKLLTPAGFRPAPKGLLTLPALRDFYRWQLRPMLKLTNAFEQEEKCFTYSLDAFSSESSNPGGPTALSNALSGKWADLQRLGQSVCHVHNLQVPGDATAVYIGKGRILTCEHIAEILTPSTTVEWPAVSTTAKCLSIYWTLTNADIAIIAIDSDPSNVPSASVLMTNQIATFEAGEQICAIGFPMSYGKLTGQLSDSVAGAFGDLRLSPGVVRTAVGNADRIMHDCATSDGSSGSVIVSLKSGLIVGIQTGTTTGGTEAGLANAFSPVSAELDNVVPTPAVISAQ